MWSEKSMMNILMFQLLSILPHLMYGEERQSPSAPNTQKSLRVHCEMHPKREMLENPQAQRSLDRYW